MTRPIVHSTHQAITKFWASKTLTQHQKRGPTCGMNHQGVNETWADNLCLLTGPKPVRISDNRSMGNDGCTWISDEQKSSSDATL
jgi:hypothetical protein